MNPGKSSDFEKNLNLTLLGISLFMIFNFEKTNNFSSKLFKSLGIQEIDQNKKENENKINLAPFIKLIPVAIMMYYDYASDSWTDFVGLNKITGGDKLYNHILKIVGLYGLIYTFSNGLGMSRGINQKNITALPVIRFMVIWGISYAFTKNRSEGLMGAIVYSIMRLNVSRNVLK
jgi:hypothetical protein